MSKLTTSNAFAPVASLNIRQNTRESTDDSTSLNTGRIARLSVVKNSISNRLTHASKTLSLVRNELTQQRSQLAIMANSTAKLQQTLSDMRGLVLAAASKDDKTLKNTAMLLENKAHEFNTHLEHARFNKQYLLGGLDFNVDVRVGKDSDDSFAMNMRAINPILTKTKIKTFFDSAVGVGALILREIGVDNLASLAFGIFEAVLKANDSADTACDARKQVIDCIDAAKKDAAKKTPANRYMNQIYSAVTTRFGPSGDCKDIGTKYNNVPKYARGFVLKAAIDITIETISPIIGGGHLPRVLAAIIKGQICSNTDTKNNVVKKVAQEIQWNIKALDSEGGIIGQSVIDALDDAPSILGVANTQDANVAIKEVLRHGLNVALDSAIKAATELAVDDAYGQHNEGVAKHMYEAVRVGANQIIFDDAMRELRDTIEVIRNNPQATSAQGIGEFKNNDLAFDSLREVIKAGPKAIENTLAAVASVNAAVRRGDVSDAVRLSDVRLDSQEDLKRIEDMLLATEKLVNEKDSQIRAYMISIDSFADSMSERVNVINEIEKDYSATNITETAQQFSDKMHKLQTSFAVLQSGKFLSQDIEHQVRAAITRG